ncbi:ABC transporter permease [Candidatus Berkiella cookevillensis]|uniref:ABC transporter permease n=1 Tax=Candidatus Berkiella cookevillensis TaxID=437022 RepID=A0A0Q9YAD5_9GAMM|nr:ABC transporter permease [Candidatus Berkiella cookevillensis]MCS5708054.1 ABC transporter permease [Candidatus Berkiella cookevillensis]
MNLFWLTELLLLLKYYKLRFALALFVISLGIMSFTMFVILQSSVKAHLEQVFSQVSQSNFVAHLAPKSAAERKNIQRYLSYPEVNEALSLITEIAENKTHAATQILPFQIIYEKALRFQEVLEADLVLIYPQLLHFLNVSTKEGHFFSQNEHQEKVIVIGSNIAKDYACRGFNPIGEKISIRGSYYEIVGVLENAVNNPLVDFDLNQSILIDYSFLPVLGSSPYQSFFVSGHGALNETQKHFKQYLNDKFQLTSVFIKDANLYMHAMLSQITLTLNILKWIAVMNVSLGILVLVNILVLLIEERVPEMGIRLCVGALKQDLLWMFVRESMSFCFISGVIGLILGVPASYFIVNKLNLLYEISLFDMLWILPASVLCGLVAGIIPALFVARKNPAMLL